MTERPFSVSHLGALADHWPAHRPALIALDDTGQPTVWRYGELRAQACRLGSALLARGLPPGAAVAILAANSADYVVALLGLARAGLVAVPLNIKFPAQTQAEVLADSGAVLVLHDTAHCPPGALPAIAFGSSAWHALLAEGNPRLRPQPLAGLALLLYTSGSTGRPKGVRLSHAAQCWTVRTRLQDTPLDQERALIAAPLYHMNALALTQLALASGATAILLPRFEARAYLQAISTHRATWLTAVPPMIAMLLREGEALARADLSSVRVIRLGSAPVPDKLWRQIRSWLPRARVINAYGTTEGGPVVFGPHPQGLPTPPASVGYPHPDVRLRLVPGPDDDADTGLLELRSPGLMQGYHRRPDLPSPFTHDGYYRSGDVFRRDAQGFYTFVGRRDDMFVCGGENIYPAEVERILEGHPSVQQACVVPVSDDIKGAKPVAFVVARDGQAIDAAALQRHALAHAPAYQHPRRIWALAALPLNGTHKIDRAALAREAARRLASPSLTATASS